MGFFIAFLAGALAFLSPCMLPVLPGLLAVLGITTRDGARKEGWLRVALAFVLGLSLMFTIIGAGVGVAAELLRPILPATQWLLGIGLVLAGSLVILFETSLIYRIPGLRLLAREFTAKEQARTRTEGWAPPLRAFAIGAGFGLSWTPCIGPFLGAIMDYAVTSGDMVGTTALFASFSFGMGLMFLLAAVIGARVFARVKRFARIIAIGSGVVLILLGLMFLLGYTDDVNRLLTQWIPDLGRSIARRTL